MTVTIRVPQTLRAYSGGAPELASEAPTVGAALDQLGQEHPRLYLNICDETGAVRRHLNIFVNSSHVRDRQGLATELMPGDVITILPAVSGG